MGESSQSLEAVGRGGHVCFLYDGDDDPVAAVAPFVARGLAEGERCVYVVGDHDPGSIRARFEQSGIDVRRELERGALAFVEHWDVSFVDGEFDPPAMIRYVREAIQGALADGFRGLRIVAEMTWALKMGVGYAKLIQYEALGDQLYPDEPLVAVCLYDRARFPAAVCRDAIRVHPWVAVGRTTYRNVFFEPPAEVADDEDRVGWMIDQLSALQAANDRQVQLEQARAAQAEAQAKAALGRLRVQEAAVRALSHSRGLEAVLTGVLESVCRALDWQLAEAWVVDTRDSVLRCTARWRAADRDTGEMEVSADRRTFTKGEGLPGRVWERREPQFVSDVRVDAGFARWREATESGLHSAIAFPVATPGTEGDIQGVMCFFTDAEAEPTPELLSMLANIGETLGHALEHNAAEERLRTETHVNETLSRLALAFSSERDEKALLQSVTDAATDVVRAAHGAFFFNEEDADGEAYLLVTVSGAERERFSGFPAPRKTPLFAPTFEGEGPVRLENVREHPSFGGTDRMPEGHPTITSYLAVPVTARSGQVLGGLFFGHPEPGRFTAQHERLVTGIAAHAGVAIENLRLYATGRGRVVAPRGAPPAAEEAGRRKDQFLAMLSHELRNPLAPIRTAVDLMKLESDEQTLRRCRTAIERQARHLETLVDDLLDISRIAQGKISIDPRPMALSEAVDAAVEAVDPLVGSRGHQLHLELAPALWIRGDRVRIVQVLTNLLSNAARYTRPGGNIWLEGEEPEGRVVVRVRDDGAGMDASEIAGMFEPFAQGQQGLDRSQGGLGLGLALARALVEMHDGTIVGRSDGRGRGSEFEVRLPRLALEEGRPPEVTPSHGFRRDALAPKRLLLVDDNPDATELLGRILRRLGHEVTLAHDGPSALRIAGSLDPDVAILDIGLPVMDGYELARRLRALDGLEAVRLIAVTGYGQRGDRERSAEAGFDAHLVKPVAVDDLVAALADAEAFS